MNGPAVVVLDRDDRPMRPGEPQKRSATFGDEFLVQGSRDPEHDVCRALAAKGITGKVKFFHRVTGMAGLTMDIAKGAGRNTVEGGNGSPVIRRLAVLNPSPESESALAGHIVPEAAE